MFPVGIAHSYLADFEFGLAYVHGCETVRMSLDCQMQETVLNWAYRDEHFQ